MKHFPLDWRLLELQSAWTTVCGFLRFIFLLPHDLCGYFNPWVPMTSNEEWDHLTPPKLIGKFEMFPRLHVWSHFNSKVVWLDIWFPKLKITKWFNPHNLRLLTRTSFCKSLRCFSLPCLRSWWTNPFDEEDTTSFSRTNSRFFSTWNISRRNVFHSIKFNVIYARTRSFVLLMISHQILMMAPDAIKLKEFLHFHQSFWRNWTPGCSQIKRRFLL